MVGALSRGLDQRFAVLLDEFLVLSVGRRFLKSLVEIIQHRVRGILSDQEDDAPNIGQLQLAIIHLTLQRQDLVEHSDTG